MDKRQLLVNKIICPDGFVLESHHRHDYREHTQEDGKTFFIDGGLSYQRIGGNTAVTNAALYYGDSHEELREHFSWGSYGKSGKEALHYIKLKDITDEHLSALVDYTMNNPVPEIRMLFVDEEAYREGNLEWVNTAISDGG